MHVGLRGSVTGGGKGPWHLCVATERGLCGADLAHQTRKRLGGRSGSPIFPPLPAVASDGPWALVRILWKVGSPSGTPAPLTRPQPGLGCPSPGQLAFAGGNVIKVVSPERICFKESKAQSVQGLRAAVEFPAASCRRPRAEQASWRTRSEAARGRREGEQNPVSGKWQGSAGCSVPAVLAAWLLKAQTTIAARAVGSSHF